MGKYKPVGDQGFYIIYPSNEWNEWYITVSNHALYMCQSPCDRLDQNLPAISYDQPIFQTTN